MSKPHAQTFIICGVVLRKNNKFLLVQEKKPEVYGKWNLPSGRADEGDTLEQTAVREAKEETGFDVELTGHLLTLHQAAERPILHAFSAKITSGELNIPEHEIMDAQWFTYDEIVNMKESLRNPDYILGALQLKDSL